jgi:hypothetical protein
VNGRGVVRVAGTTPCVKSKENQGSSDHYKAKDRGFVRVAASIPPLRFPKKPRTSDHYKAIRYRFVQATATRPPTLSRKIGSHARPQAISYGSMTRAN